MLVGLGGIVGGGGDGSGVGVALGVGGGWCFAAPGAAASAGHEPAAASAMPAATISTAAPSPFRWQVSSFTVPFPDRKDTRSADLSQRPSGPLTPAERPTINRDA